MDDELKKAAYSRFRRKAEPPTWAEGVRLMNSTAELSSSPARTSDDALTDVLRDDAQRLLAQAVEAEVDAWITDHGHVVDGHGHRVVSKYTVLLRFSCPQ